MYQTRDTFDNTTQYDLPFVLLNTSYHLNTTLFLKDTHHMSILKQYLRSYIFCVQNESIVFFFQALSIPSMFSNNDNTRLMITLHSAF